MQTTSATWKQLWAAGAPLEARAMIAGTETLLAAAPVITRAAMQNRLSVGNVASASLALAVRTAVAIPRSAAVAVEARLNDGETASEWLPMGTFYISRRSRDPVTGVTALECYDALLKANAVWTPSAGAWPRTMAAVLAELLTLLDMTLDSRTVIPSGLSFVIGQPGEGATIRDVLGTIAQAGGGNWIVTPAGKLRLLPLVDTAGAGEATEDALDVAGVVGGMGVVPAGTITGVRCTADGSVTLIGDDTGIVVDMSLATLIAADMADMLIGQRYQAYTLTGAVCDPAAELGDYVRAGVNGEVASVLYGAQIVLGRACRGDLAAPEAGEATDEYPYIGGSARTLALAKAYVNQAVGALDGELTQREIFNRLTDNGAAQGLVMLNNQLYINASYINAGSLNVSYINFNDPGAHYDIPNENDPSTLLDGQSVSGGWIVNTSGSGYIKLLQCDYAVPLRGMTVSVTFTYDVWRDGSQTMDNDGEDCWTYIDSDASEVEVQAGWFHIPETQNPFTHSFTVPDDANTFWIRVNCTGVKAISVSLSGTVVPTDDINFTYAGLDVGKFLLNRDGNIITEGASIFKGDASFTKASIRELKMSAPLPVASGGTGATTAANARTNLGITPANIGAVPYLGNLSSIGIGTPAAATKTYWEENIPNYSVNAAYNNSGAEYTILFSRGGNSSYGSVLKYGYTDLYLRILRRNDNNWLSEDWQKISAGYADSAGSVAWGNVSDKPSNYPGGCTGAAAYLAPISVTNDDSAMPDSGTYFQVYKLTGSSSTIANDGHLMSFTWSSGGKYGAQLFIDTDPTYNISLRQRDGSGTWQAWKRIPMGDGTGASGTWGINITGNAANVTGTVAVGHGGTGATTKSGARSNLGIKYKDISVGTSSSQQRISTDLDASTCEPISAVCTNCYSSIAVIQGFGISNNKWQLFVGSVSNATASIRVTYFEN